MVDIEKSCCFTGYRAEKFPFALNNENDEYKIFESRLTAAVSSLLSEGVNCFYTGMANGFDIIAAEITALIKNIKPEIRLIAVVPFKNQEKSFSNDWKQRYYSVLEAADEVVTLNEKYEKWAFSERNKYIVDRCRHVLAFYDGKAGGTKSTLQYASKVCRNIINIYETESHESSADNYKFYYRIIGPNE